MKILVNSNEIFDYIVGNTCIDPIERAMGNFHRFEAMNSFVYDYLNEKMLIQGEDYCLFYQELDQLRENFVAMDRNQIINKCNELSQIAPRIIYE